MRSVHHLRPHVTPPRRSMTNCDSGDPCVPYVPCVWVVLFAQFDLPAGQGKLAVKVKVMASDTYTNSLLYTYKSPIVVAVSPSDIPAAGGALLVISGQDLGVDLTAAGRVLGGAANATWRSNSVSIGTSGDCEVVEVGYIASDVPV